MSSEPASGTFTLDRRIRLEPSSASSTSFVAHVKRYIRSKDLSIEVRKFASMEGDPVTIRITEITGTPSRHSVVVRDVHVSTYTTHYDNKSDDYPILKGAIEDKINDMYNGNMLKTLLRKVN